MTWPSICADDRIRITTVSAIHGQRATKATSAATASEIEPPTRGMKLAGNASTASTMPALLAAIRTVPEIAAQVGAQREQARGRRGVPHDLSEQGVGPVDRPDPAVPDGVHDGFTKTDNRVPVTAGRAAGRACGARRRSG